jgi:hypothetical protein
MHLPVPFLLPILFTVTVTAADTYRIVSNNKEFVADSVLPLKPHKEATPVKLKSRSTNPRDIFARACYYPNRYCGSGCCPPETPWCCEYTSCMDRATSVCCRGGMQCDKGEDCCDSGCVRCSSLRSFVVAVDINTGHSVPPAPTVS